MCGVLLRGDFFNKEKLLIKKIFVSSGGKMLEI